MTIETHPDTTEPRSRRAILSGALAGVVGLVVGKAIGPEPAAAAAGSPLIIGNLTNNAGVNGTTLTTNSAQTGLYVAQNGSGTAIRANTTGGIAGFFTSGSGNGISGVTASNTKFGVYGANDHASYGGGEAIRADGKQNHGVVATTANASASAIIATNSAGTGNAVKADGGDYGVYATADYSALRGEGGTYGSISSGSSVGAYGSGGTYGVYGSGSAYGVYGAGSTYGVYADGPTGVYGNGSTYGVVGVVGGGGADAVRGDGGQYGVHGVNGYTAGIRGDSGYVGAWGQATSYGVYGLATDGVNQTYGVFGQASNGASFAVFANGNMHVQGTLSKVAGAFKIDHPLDPEERWLFHSFVESPDMMNVYNGNVVLDATGSATVALPAYFETLNRDYRYQLTGLGKPAPSLHVGSEIHKNAFGIAGGSPGQTVSWQITGIRQDDYAKAHPIVVETAKTKSERGTRQFVPKGSKAKLMKPGPAGGTEPFEPTPTAVPKKVTPRDQ
jgi:hypothetical protein